MRVFDRKLLRDLARMNAPAAAIALVVTSGVAVFIGTVTASRALVLFEARYYEQNRLVLWRALELLPLLSSVGRAECR